jgi:hypothetical protein
MCTGEGDKGVRRINQKAMLSMPLSHRSKHGSDTHVFDQEGRFHPALFENIFTKYDRERKGGLTFMDGMRMLVSLNGVHISSGRSGWIRADLSFWAASQYGNRVVADFVR